MSMHDESRKNASAESSNTSITRRDFIRSAAMSTAALTLGSAGRAFSAPLGPSVAIIGGGVAGLTAAQELAERGFQVSVFEQRAWGGKARSIPVPGTGTQGRAGLPGEHGYRFFAGFYKNLPHTLQRILFDANGSVWSHMVQAPSVLYAHAEKGDFHVSMQTILQVPTSAADLPRLIQEYLNVASFGMDIPPWEVAFLASKLHVFMTSSEVRRMQQWENMSWWEYCGAETRSRAYQELFGDLSTIFVAARGRVVSARTMASIIEATIYNYARRGYSYPVFNLLDRPTTEAWIDPWCDYLRSLGVSLNQGARITGFEYANGRVTGAQVLTNGIPTEIQADWYILAVPSEAVLGLLPAAMRAADARFGRIAQLTQDWMTGIQFFLRESRQLGQFACLATPWAITGLTQAPFWAVDFPASYGDGNVRDVLSIDISNWNVPGILFGLPARQCTPAQVAAETLAQLRAALDNGPALLPDSIIHSWVIDPGLTGLGTPNVANADPLFINAKSSWSSRPDTVTKVANFFLAGDYVRATGFDLACMETANEGGRRAANAVLAASGINGAPATIFERYEEPLLAPLHLTDATLFQLGLANAFDLMEPYVP